MKTKILISSLILVPFVAFAQDIQIQISASSQLNPQARAKNACYQAAEQMRAAGLPMKQQMLKKESISILPGDVYYSLFESEKGSKCALLDEEATQSKAWDLGPAHIAGCICDLIIPIK